MRPIISATGTYNYDLAKCLDEKLKPLSTNEFTISDVFNFAEEIQHYKTVSYRGGLWHGSRTENIENHGLGKSKFLTLGRVKG